jgi:alpha-L-rhamnosidase
MKIIDLKTNRLENPIGYDFKKFVFSYVVVDAKGKMQKSARILVAKDPKFIEIVFDSGEDEKINSTGYTLDRDLEDATRYYWKVFCTDDCGATAESEVAWFETPKRNFQSGKWISPITDRHTQVVLFREIDIKKPVKQARAYVSGVGLYEFYINRQKQGDECLLPGFTNYDYWIQYQTYPIHLEVKKNLVELVLAEGWYKGWFGLRKTHDNYGTRLAGFIEIDVQYEDGTSEVFGTDATWQARRSKVVESSIYLGEVFDMTLNTDESFPCEVMNQEDYKMMPRLSPQLRVQEKIRPIQKIITPKNEVVLDMGQNMVGWLGFKSKLPRGHKLYFQFGEILQDNCFYRDNLRTAKAEFTYVSDGEERLVRQHFTFYGFRYVKVEGWPGELNLADFEGQVIYSDMAKVGEISTKNSLVNQFIQNTIWGMKGNFLDIPTDCPQRDERCGWTGDAQIFSGTACYLRDTSAFFKKFGRDIYSEQLTRDGSVPDTVPVCNNTGDGTAAWGDAATIIPWNVYLHFADRSILEQQYPSMKAWVDYIKKQDDAGGSKRLWLNGFHYGDWLALDGKIEGGVFGATNPGFIASAYYYHSTCILTKAAAVLDKTEDEKIYSELADAIKQAFFREYYTPSGKLAVDTMTAYVVAVYMDLVPEAAMPNIVEGLRYKLIKNRYHLETGFVGTPYLCRVLSKIGLNDLAYTLLLQKDFPSWLYQVTMGATTVWERWNSVLPDGKISGTEMNSLNHYAYGSVVEWIFRNMAGIRPSEEGVGYKKFSIVPQPNYQIPGVEASMHSASGLIYSSWTLEAGRLIFDFIIPFDTEAEIVLPDVKAADLDEQISCLGDDVRDVMQNGSDLAIRVLAGQYHFEYEPTVPYRKVYSIYSSLEELESNPKTLKILEDEYYTYVPVLPFKDQFFTLYELMNGPFSSISHEQQKKIDDLLRAID